MTCIAGVVHQGLVYLGGDSIAIDGYHMDVRGTPKVFKRGPFVFGCCGSFRMADVLRYRFTPPALPSKGTLHRYMATVFVDGLREAFKAHGVGAVENNVEGVEGAVLVGVAGQLFVIESDYQVGHPAQDFTAIGCGAAVALGALHALPAAQPRPRLTAALTAACAFNAGVKAPFHFVRTTHPRRSRP